MLRAVLDTQIILRGATPPPTSITAQIYTAWDAGQFELLLSDPIVHEVGNVLGRPEVLRKLRMTFIEAAAILELLRRRGTWVAPTIAIRQSRDPDDDKFLECAVAGGANYVVSADTDLLSLHVVEGIPIVDAPTFWQQLLRQAERHE